MLFKRSFIVSLVLVVSQLAFSQEKVVYMTLDKDEKNPTIFLADANGKNAKEIVKGAYPDISADGKKLAYLEGDKDNERIFDVRVLNLETGENINLTNGKKGYFHPNFSGNGRYLAFSYPTEVDNKTRNQIMIVDLTKSENSRELILTDGSAYFPRLSADGRFVVFHQTFEPTEFRKGKLKQVYMYDRLGRDPKKRLVSITSESEYCLAPALSFDDRQIAFACRDVFENEKNTTIYIVQTFDLKAPRIKVTTHTGMNLSPAFRPNGSLVFSYPVNGLTQLFEANRMSGGFLTREFITGPFVYYDPAFTGDLKYTTQKPELEIQGIRTSFGAALTKDNNLFVVGGQIKGEHEHDQVGITGKTQLINGQDIVEVSQKPHPAQGFGIVRYGNKIYTFGGLTGEKDEAHSIDWIDIFDLDSKQWTTSDQKLLTPRSSHDVAVWKDKAYILGGWNYTPDYAKDHDQEGEYLGSIEVFDFKTGKISVLGQKIAAPMRRAFSAAVGSDGILLVGGMTGGKTGGFFNGVTLFNPEGSNENAMWKELPKLPCGSFAPVATVLNGSLYWYGGFCQHVQTNPGSVRASNHIYRLDYQRPNSAWVHTGRYMYSSRAFFQAVKTSDRRVIIIGGTYVPSGDYQSSKDSLESFSIR